MAGGDCHVQHRENRPGFRAAQWLAPIPIGWILLVIMRGNHWREIEQVEGGAAASAARLAEREPART